MSSPMLSHQDSSSKSLELLTTTSSSRSVPSNKSGRTITIQKSQTDTESTKKEIIEAKRRILSHYMKDDKSCLYLPENAESRQLIEHWLNESARTGISLQAKLYSLNAAYGILQDRILHSKISDKQLQQDKANGNFLIYWKIDGRLKNLRGSKSKGEYYISANQVKITVHIFVKLFRW